MNLVTTFTALSLVEFQLVGSRFKAADVHSSVADELSPLNADDYSVAAGEMHVPAPEGKVSDALVPLNPSAE